GGAGNITQGAASVISGSGTGVVLTKSGAGTLTLDTGNTYAGKTSVTGGTLSINADDALGAAPGAAVADQLSLSGGGTLSVTANTTLIANRGITVGAGDGTISAATLTTTTINGDVALGGNALTL